MRPFAEIFSSRLMGWRPRVRLAIFPLLAVLSAVTLRCMGRVWWCQDGDLLPWSWDVWSRHNSQHFLDPYTLSHIEHGIGLYLLLTVLPGMRWTTYSRALVVAVVEAAWEIAENTDWMIQRYREATISLDYFGDSVLNSCSDYVACMGGVLMAQRLPWQLSCILLVCLELLSTWWIRDGLLLNILMLLYPIEAIRQWQMGGQP